MWALRPASLVPGLRPGVNAARPTLAHGITHPTRGDNGLVRESNPPCPVKAGALDRNRTRDPTLTKRPLYLLSYEGWLPRWDSNPHAVSGRSF